MKRTLTILYIHGMGGGGDSRIPSILRESMPPCVSVVCRTYDFDPETAHAMIEDWVRQLQPDLVIGESLGALHAMRIEGVPRLFVSPALNAPVYFGVLSWLAYIPGVTLLFDRYYHPREGDRQSLHFSPSVLGKYSSHRKAAFAAADRRGETFHAFFGTHDHYRRSGVVSVKLWKRLFGNCFTMYEGSHFMEDEHIYGLLIPMILKVLSFPDRP